MERRSFFKNILLGLGSFFLGSAGTYRLIREKNIKEAPKSSAIEIIQKGSKKNILVLMGSGTRHGNTDQLTDAYIRGLVKQGYSVTKVYLGRMRLEGCRGCGVCQRKSKKCIIKDGMQDLYSLFAECDTLVMSSPLYFATVTARLKAFIERLYAISIEDKYPTKDTVWLMTAGDNEEKSFEHSKQYFNLMSEVFGNNQKGVYCAGDCTGCEELARNINQFHLDNVYQMGLHL